MKLDKRILPEKRPLTCFDTEYARQFIGKTGFFADELDRFCDLSKMSEATLKNVWQNETRCFFAYAMRFKYFLPSEWVNPEKPENKWRPFSLTEWRNIYGIGDNIKFKLKNSDAYRMFMYNGYVSDHDNDLPGQGVISLGFDACSLNKLFNDFELWDKATNKWQPFGVEVTK